MSYYFFLLTSSEWDRERDHIELAQSYTDKITGSPPFISQQMDKECEREMNLRRVLYSWCSINLSTQSNVCGISTVDMQLNYELFFYSLFLFLCQNEYSWISWARKLDSSTWKCSIVQINLNSWSGDKHAFSTITMEGSSARQTCDLCVFDNKPPHSSIRALSPPTTLANSEIEVSISSA